MKKYHIVFNSKIYTKLENIFSYIALESVKTANDIINGIEKQIISLEEFPERFPLTPEKTNYKNYQTRHFFYKRTFRIIYVVRKTEVRILDIRHGAQDYLKKEDLN